MAQDDGIRRRERSPGYPGISLPVAIERAQTLYDRERRNAAPVATVVRHWGFKNPTNGAATVALSALEKFGLVEASGSGSARRVKLTDLAFTILQNPDENARAAAIRRAALNPPIFRTLWNDYQGVLPSNETLRYELMTTKRFSERGATHLIPAFRATVAYAGLEDRATADDQSPETGEEASDGNRDLPVSPGRGSDIFKHDYPRTQMEPGVVTIPVLLPGSEPVTITGKFPITEAAWKQLRTVLDAMKAGLVSSEAPEAGRPDDEAPESY